jgi:hypothetical protein
MKTARIIVLGVLGALAACAGSSGTESVDDGGTGPVRIDGGRKDAAAKADSGDEGEGDAAITLDAGKKDSGSGLKDAGTSDVSVSDAAPSDANPPLDASFVDAFVDAGPASTTLVINEIDYDQPINDDAEFVEIYNVSAGTVDLTNLALAFFNGSTSGQASTEYLRIPLGPGSLGAGEYLLVRATATVTDAGTASIVKEFAAAKNNVQNGERDSIAIVDVISNAVVDAVTYQPLDGAQPMNATYTLVEGHVATAVDSNTVVGSIVRAPNGNDTNDNDVDFSFTSTPTPGAANVVTP